MNKFEEIARNPKTSKEDLKRMRQNALQKGQREFAAVAEEILSERFPDWQRTRQSSGRTPTTAYLRGEARHFDTGKDAYIWLVQQFQALSPGLLEENQKLQLAFKNIPGRHFARHPGHLFKNPEAAFSSGSVEKVSEGWYANTVLNHESKFRILLGLSALCDLDYPGDWDFRVTGGTSSLAERQRTAEEVERLLKDLFGEQKRK